MRGKGLGKRVTGAVVARMLWGSPAEGMRAGGGRTVRPRAIVRSLMVRRRADASAVVKGGG